MQNSGTYQTEAYDSIKELILKADLKPGQKVSKRELVNMLNIGDTPVREAIIRLTKEGLFRVVPQSGTYISKIKLKEMQNAQFIRNNIESLVVAEAFDIVTNEQIMELEKQIKIQEIHLESNDHDTFFQLDEEFHKQFYIITNKNFVWDWMKLVSISLNRYRYLRLEMKDLSWENIIEEHKLIVEYIKNKNKKELMNVISNHLHMIDKEINLVLKAYPDYFEI